MNDLPNFGIHAPVALTSVTLSVTLSFMNKTHSEMCRLCGDLAGASDLDTALDTLARNITGIMDVKGCTIRVLDEKKQTLEIVAAHGLNAAYLKKGPVILKDHPVDRKVLKGAAISTEDITKEKHVLYRKDAKREGIKSVLSVPLKAEHKIIGVIRVYTTMPHVFSREEVDKLKALAWLGGILAGRARIWDQMQALIRIAQSINSTLSLDAVLQMIVENAARTLGMKAASLRLLDTEKNILEVRAAFGLSRAYLEKGPVEVEKSRIDRECLQCRVIAIKDVKKDKRLQYATELASEGIGSLLSLPLTVKGHAIGVLRVYTSVPYAFQASEIEFLSALACQGAIAIENARLFEHVRKEYSELARDVWKWYDWGSHFPKI
jgi:signal transduction protein with GAF and PtsI domain